MLRGWSERTYILTFGEDTISSQAFSRTSPTSANFWNKSLADELTNPKAIFSSQPSQLHPRQTRSWDFRNGRAPERQ